MNKMIISASRRTDIPTYYSDWFFNILKEKYVFIRNPINKNQISKINISPEVVDCIIFWTKNPKPMMKRLDELKEYKYYFQFTLTSYGKDMESNVPSKNNDVIESFQTLADKIGKKRVVWRYDPILLNEKYSINYHIKYFENIAKKLFNYTDKCIISFIDMYKKVEKNIKDTSIVEINFDRQREIAKEFSYIAKKYNITIETCAEKIELSEYGIGHAKCIDDKLISKIVGYDIKAKKDSNQRMPCGCVESIDIGSYNTCLNGCKYCYANFSNKEIENKRRLYDPTIPFLCDIIKDNDKVTERKIKSYKEVTKQLKLDL